MGRCQARAQRTQEDTGEVVLDATHGKKLFRSALQPCIAVTAAKALLEQRFKNTWGAMGMIPDQVFRVELGPILFKNPEARFEFAPHFCLRVRCDDGDLRSVEFERRQRAQVLVNGFGSFQRQADDVITLGVQAGAIEFGRQLECGLDFFVLMHLFQNFLMKAFDAEKRAFQATFLPFLEIAEKQIDARLHQPPHAMPRKQFDNGVRM